LASATIRRATGSGKVFCPTPDPPTQPVYTVDECCVNQKSGPGIEREKRWAGIERNRAL
jgi:hypothetical protein